MTAQGSLFTNTAPGFYNTTNLEGEELKQKRERVVGQTGEILEIFCNHPHWKFSPWEIWERLHKRYPITSIRRGITDLTKGGYLVKTDERIRCKPYNDFSYQWMLHPDKKK